MPTAPETRAAPVTRLAVKVFHVGHNTEVAHFDMDCKNVLKFLGGVLEAVVSEAPAGPLEVTLKFFKEPPPR